jgi:plastocyanin
MRPTPRTRPRILSATVVALSFLASASATASAGCAAVVGVEDFSVEGEGATASASSGGPMINVCQEVHGCRRETAEDHTVDVNTTVSVGFDEKGYSPACIRIQTGWKVKFNSAMHTFANYSIAGGIAPKVEPESPITETKASVNEATFTIPGEKCGYPYFSPDAPNTHKGAIFVGGLAGSD